MIKKFLSQNFCVSFFMFENNYHHKNKLIHSKLSRCIAKTWSGDTGLSFASPGTSVVISMHGSFKHSSICTINFKLIFGVISYQNL